VEIGKIENYGMQDAENGDSCKKPALYIYIYIYNNNKHLRAKSVFVEDFFPLWFISYL